MCHVFDNFGVAVEPSATWEAEISARISKANNRFLEMRHVWQLRKLKVELNLKSFRAYVSPVLLFGT
jgi:hypothetical protein